MNNERFDPTPHFQRGLFNVKEWLASDSIADFHRDFNAPKDNTFAVQWVPKSIEHPTDEAVPAKRRRRDP